MNTTQAIKQTAELAETIGAGFVIATDIFPSGSYSTSADDRGGRHARQLQHLRAAVGVVRR